MTDHPTELDRALLSRHDAVLLDLDGTVYHGRRPVPGAAEAIEHVRNSGGAVRFVTNNASKAPSAVAEHLRDLGVPADDAEVSTSAQAGVRLLAARLPGGARVLVVGTDALAAEVTAAGLHPVRDAHDVAAVVQGHNPDTAWPILAEACLAIRAGALWVACNADPTLPTERGPLPGNGSMVAALRTATDREPVVAGKPQPALFRAAAEGARDPLVVGDRLDTDIAGAVAAGMASLFVLSGVVTPADLLAAGPGERPTYVARSIAAITGKADELEIGTGAGWRIEPTDDTLVVTSDGGSEPLGLLRALCPVAWRHGITTVRGADETATRALAELLLG